jgi:indolepyruvate ferredoxin oxidoreductase alpha subunit
MYPDAVDIDSAPAEPTTSPYARANYAQRRQYSLVVNGDIGCYTLGALQPLWAMDTCGCMGASIGYAIGMEKAGVKNKVVAVIGDSTFYHSGITGLVDVITSGSATTIIILDNFTTAMTGGNANPGSGKSVNGQPARRIELETLCRGLGVEDVHVIDAYDNDAITTQLDRSVANPEPSVLIIRAPCVLQERASHTQVSWVEADKCVACWACLATACPALIRSDGKVAIIPEQCTDCNVCNQVCPYDAILRVDRSKEAVTA